MPLKRGTWFLPAVCISLVVSSGAARAEDKPSIEPRAERILKAALGNLAAAKSYMFRGELTNEVPDRPQGSASSTPAPFRPPCAVRTAHGPGSRGSSGRGSNWYDGKTFTHLDLGSQRLRDLAGAADHRRAARQDEGEARLPAADAPPDAPEPRDKRCIKGMKSGIYVGEAVVRGSTCSHLAFSQEKIDWQLWIDNVVPVIRRIVITYKRLPGSSAVRRHLHRLGFQRDAPGFCLRVRSAAGRDPGRVRDREAVAI